MGSEPCRKRMTNDRLLYGYQEGLLSVPHEPGVVDGIE